MFLSNILLLVLLCLIACYVLAQEDGNFRGSVDEATKEQHVDVEVSRSSQEGFDNESEAVQKEEKPAFVQDEAPTIPTRPQENTDAPVFTAVGVERDELHPEVLGALLDNIKGEMAYMEVTDSTWKKEVFDHPGPVAMIVYNSDNCKPSSMAMTEFEYASRVLKEKIKCVAVEGMKNDMIRLRYQIQGFPHMRLYGVDRRHTIPYHSKHDNETFVQVLSEFADKVRSEEARIAAATLAAQASREEL